MNPIRVWILCCTFAATASFAQETSPLPTTIIVDGVTYSNVSWRTVTPATVSIFHQTGVASIALKELPSDLQKRFGYDPQRAADYSSAEVATQARLAAHIADVKEGQRIQQLEESLQEQYAAIHPPQPPPAPVDQTQAQPRGQVVPLTFTTLQFQPPSNGLNCAIITLTSGGTASVAYGADGEKFMNRSFAEHAVWLQQEHNLAQSRAAGSYCYYWWQQMSYTHRIQTYTVYGAQIGFNTYKLLGNATYQKMGGPITYIWR